MCLYVFFLVFFFFFGFAYFCLFCLKWYLFRYNTNFLGYGLLGPVCCLLKMPRECRLYSEISVFKEFLPLKRKCVVVVVVVSAEFVKYKLTEKRMLEDCGFL